MPEPENISKEPASRAPLPRPHKKGSSVTKSDGQKSDPPTPGDIFAAEHAPGPALEHDGETGPASAPRALPPLDRLPDVAPPLVASEPATPVLRAGKPSVPPPERPADHGAIYDAGETAQNTLPPLKVPPRTSVRPTERTPIVFELATFALLFALPYYAAVWEGLLVDVSLPIKVAVTVGSALAFGLFAVTTRLRSKRWYRAVTQAVLVVLVAGGAAGVAILYTASTQIELLKLFSVLLLAAFPGALYLVFVSTRGATFWDEYVQNLFRLRVDDYAFLPAPPPRSAYHAERETATRARFPGAALTAERARSVSIYEKKYTALFGHVPDPNLSTFSMLRGENLWSVALLTALFSVGWVIVLEPSSAFGMVLFIESGSNAALGIPIDSMRFAFMGAYVYSLQRLVRRYSQGDLKTGAYVYALLRVVAVLLLVWVVEQVLPETLGSGERKLLAFAIGIFPEVGWRLVIALAKSLTRTMLPSLRNDLPLSDLDGLSNWHEARLLEEGIADMQNLATANLVDAMLETRLPVSRLVDWVDQALLCLRVSKVIPEGGNNQESDRQKLRRYGIRSATDLLDALGPHPETSELVGLLDRPGDTAHVLLTVTRSLQGETNLQHVRAWKSNLAQANRDRTSSNGARAL